MSVEMLKSIEIVLEKRRAVKAHEYNNAELKNWVDFADVRGHFSYARSNERQVISSSRLQVDSCIWSYTNKPIRVAMIKTVSMKKIFFINYFSNRILQAVFTQPAKDSPSFLDCSSISFNKSSSKRKVFIELLGRSYFKFFPFLSCIGNIQNVYFYLLVISNIIHIELQKTMPRSAGTLSEHLTQPLSGVMIMANRYDNAHLCARQSKLYKFYDLSTAQVVETKATTERQARQNLGKQSLIFIARKPLTPTFERSINWGGYVHA